MRNSIGRAAEGAPNDQATRQGAGEGAAQDNIKSNAGTQRDGTPTNIGAAPTKPGSSFFKPSGDGPKSGMEKAMGDKFKR